MFVFFLIYTKIVLNLINSIRFTKLKVLGSVYILYGVYPKYLYIFKLIIICS